jgi:hypothetical protein
MFTDGLFTVIVTEAQEPSVQPSPRTKYVVVVVGATLIEVPDPTKVPPQESVYQNQSEALLREPAVTLSEVEEPIQMAGAPGVMVAAVGGRQ